MHSVTVNLPDKVYKEIKQASQKSARSMDELLVEAISAVAPTLGSSETAPQFRSALSQMAYLNDAALWQAARGTLTNKQREQLESLHHKRQRQESLSEEEQHEMEALETLYRETVLIRAQAAVLLKQRGYDVSGLSHVQRSQI
ncbi:MAG: hypothetical protein R6X32_05705 [Chloroflexota bacterium]